MEQLEIFLVDVIGLHMQSHELDIRQMATRAVIVFIVAILMVRIGHKRFMGRNTTTDVLLGFVIGSILSRAITGNSPFFPTLAAAFALVCLHWLLTAISFHWTLFSRFTMGHERCLIEDGKMDKSQMRKAHVLQYDLEEALRNLGKEGDVSLIDQAYLERNGGINIILKNNGEHREQKQKGPS